MAGNPRWNFTSGWISISTDALGSHLLAFGRKDKRQATFELSAKAGGKPLQKSSRLGNSQRQGKASSLRDLCRQLSSSVLCAVWNVSSKGIERDELMYGISPVNWPDDGLST